MRILYAEDERSLSRAIVKILENNHYSVDAVYDGTQALDYLRCGTYDAVILDIMMPKMDGIAVLKAIRSEGDTTPVLMLTAKAEIEDKVLGLDSGANDYLAKPFDTKELLARLRCITRTAGTPDNKLRMGNTVLNRTTFELSTPLGKYRLANKEYQMMEYFLSNPHTVLSAERILEKIWGYETETEIQVVWVYISYLRKKLTALQADIQIKALRNAGYVLEKTDDQEA